MSTVTEFGKTEKPKGVILVKIQLQPVAARLL